MSTGRGLIKKTDLAAGGPRIKSGRSLLTAWTPLQICRKYFVLTSETTCTLVMIHGKIFTNKMKYEINCKCMRCKQ